MPNLLEALSAPRKTYLDAIFAELRQNKLNPVWSKNAVESIVFSFQQFDCIITFDESSNTVRAWFVKRLTNQNFFIEEDTFNFEVEPNNLLVWWQIVFKEFNRLLEIDNKAADPRTRDALEKLL